MTRTVRTKRKRGPATGKSLGCSMRGDGMLTLPHRLHRMCERGSATAPCWRRWSAILRQARYKKRFEADAGAGEYVDANNPLPGFTDPVTLQPVVNPAISQNGHVMGLQTWKVQKRPWPAQCPVRRARVRWQGRTQSCPARSSSCFHRHLSGLHGQTICSWDPEF